MSGLGEMLDYIGGSIDKPGRAVRGLLGGKPHEALAAIPFSDSLGLTDPKNATSGRDLTDQWGLTNKHDQGWGAWGAGLGTELALDPLNLVPAGLLGKALGKTKLGHAAGTAVKHFGADERGALGLPHDLANYPPGKMPRNAPEWVNNKTWYHGSGTPNLTAGVINPMKTDSSNLFGRGLYTTADEDMARTYTSKGVGSAHQGLKNFVGTPEFADEIAERAARGEFNDLLPPTILPRRRPDLDVHDAINKALYFPDSNPAAQAIFERAVPGYVQPKPSLYQMQPSFGNVLDIDKQLPRPDFEQFKESVRSAYHPRDWSRIKSEAGNTLYHHPENEYVPSRLIGAAVQYFDSPAGALTRALKQHGYDALTHTGGALTGGRKHQVLVGLDPNDVLGVGRKTPYQQFERMP